MGTNECKKCGNDQNVDNENEHTFTENSNNSDEEPNKENNKNTNVNNSIDSNSKDQKKTTAENEKKDEEEEESLIILLPNEEERRAKFGVFKPLSHCSQSQLSIPEEEDYSQAFYPPKYIRELQGEQKKEEENSKDNEKKGIKKGIKKDKKRNDFSLNLESKLQKELSTCSFRTYKKTNKKSSIANDLNNEKQKILKNDLSATTIVNYKFKKYLMSEKGIICLEKANTITTNSDNLFNVSFRSNCSKKKKNLPFRAYKNKSLNINKISSNLKSQNFYTNLIKKDLLFAIESYRANLNTDSINSIFLVLNCEGICIYRSKENYLYNKLPLMIIGYEFIITCSLIEIEKEHNKKLKKIFRYNFVIEINKEKITSYGEKNQLDPITVSIYKKYFNNNDELIFITTNQEEDANNFVFLVNKMMNMGILSLAK